MQKVVYIFFVTKTIDTNKKNCDQNQLKKNLSSYLIWLYERKNCPESDLYGSIKDGL